MLFEKFPFLLRKTKCKRFGEEWSVVAHLFYELIIFDNKFHYARFGVSRVVFADADLRAGGDAATFAVNAGLVASQWQIQPTSFGGARPTPLYHLAGWHFEI